MHEYSVVQSILRQLQQSIEPKQRADVREIRVNVGEFSGVDPDLLQMAFAQVVAESEFPERRLVVKTTRLKAQCTLCGTEVAPVAFVFQCSQCGSTQTRVVDGEELVLESFTLTE